MKKFLFSIVFLCSLPMSAISQDIDPSILKDAFWKYRDLFPVNDHGLIINPRVLGLYDGKTGHVDISLSYEPSKAIVVEFPEKDWSAYFLVPGFPFRIPEQPVVSPRSMTFTSENWKTPQRLSITAPSADSYSHRYNTVDVTIDGVENADYLGVFAQPLPVEAEILLSESSLRINEGGSASFKVKLSRPLRIKTQFVPLNIHSDHGSMTISPAWVHFIHDEWDTWKTVRVTVGQDSNLTNEQASIFVDVWPNPPFDAIIASNKTISVQVIDDDSPPQGNLVLSQSGTITIEEGDSQSFSVHLGARPGASVRVSLSSDNQDVSLSQRSLIFHPSAWNTPQTVSVSAQVDADTDDDHSSIFLSASGGAFIPRERLSVHVKDNHPVPSAQVWGDIVLSTDEALPIEEGTSKEVSVILSTRPNADVRIDLSSDNPLVTVSPESLTFGTSNWNKPQSFFVEALENSNPRTDHASIFLTASGGLTAPRKRLPIVMIDNDPPPHSKVRSQSLALPSSTSGDSATLRVQCKQDSPCAVEFDCSTQDGTIYRGNLPEPIPAWGTQSIKMVDIERYTGGFSWAGKGRLGCSLHSTGNISSQSWTRSGSGVLVNNSAVVRSVFNDLTGYRADIESIPSPDSSEESNIRLRCNSPIRVCSTRIDCYDDSGNKYSASVGDIEPLATRHMQSEELSHLIGYRWEGLGLSCEIHSTGQFTAQVLTRTGGGGGLVNNSVSSSLTR